MSECIIRFNPTYKLSASITYKSNKGSYIISCFYPPSFLKLLNLIKQSLDIKKLSLSCISIPENIINEIYNENFEYQESKGLIEFVKINKHYETVLDLMQLTDSLNTKEIYLDYYLKKFSLKASLQDLKQSLQQLKEQKENTKMQYYSTRFGGSKGVTIIETDSLPDEEGNLPYYLKDTNHLSYATLNKDAFKTVDEAIASIENDIKRKIGKLEKHLIKVKKQKNNL